jgi:type VI secretion system secreted protein VgrG
MTVAVIDTGVNYNNPALGGGEGPGFKVVTGYNFVQNSSDPMATTSQHGTAVAGLIASSDSTHPGVAPGADIAALEVFSGTTQGSFNTVAQALQWVINNHTQYNITAVNLSMSDGNNYAQNWFAQDGGIGQQITGLINQLTALKIPVVAATGNSFNGQQGVGFPAIVPSTISVTSTNAAGTQLSSDAQRVGPTIGQSSATDIAAPGEGLIAPVQGSQFAPVDGTSFAAAEVSGAVVLLQQIYESRFGQLPTVDQIDSWLQAGADPVSDPITDLAIGRLDVPRAAGLIPRPAAQVLSSAAPGGTAQAGSAPVVNVFSSWTSPAGNAAAPTGQQSQQTPSSHPSSTPASTAVATANAPSAPPASPPPQAADPSSSVDTLLAAAYKSLNAWASSPGGGFKVWTNPGTAQAKLGGSQPSGQIRALPRSVHVQLPSGPGAAARHSPSVRSLHHR